MSNSADVTDMETLYQDWLAICAEGYGDVLNEDEYFARYQALQHRIICMEPTSIRELAIQHYVDTDNGNSGHSEGFLKRIVNLIERGRNSDLDPRSLLGEARS